MMPGMSAEVAVDLLLPPRATSAGRARRSMRDALVLHQPGETLDAAQVAVSEIVTNALVHAGTAMRLRVLLTGGGLRVELSDGSTQLPHRRAYSSQAATGRGLLVVEEMVDRWGAYPIGGGKVVWFEIAESPGADPSAAAGAPVPAPEVPEVVATVEVELLDMPLLMHAAWQEHAAALLRELLLVRLDEDLGVIDRHASASGALSVLFEQVPAPDLRDDPDAVMASATGPAVSLDALRLEIPEPVVGDFDTLDAMLEEAVALAERGELLVPPTQPEMQSMRHWLCAQVRDQRHGAAPIPWSSPVDLLPPALASDFVWDAEPVAGSPLALVAADDANRIVAVSRPALALLGYDDSPDLVGRRLISLIPERFRQAHIAGFTLHLVNGRSPLLGTRVTVPVLRADGSERLCGLLVDSQSLPNGRHVFTAELFA